MGFVGLGWVLGDQGWGTFGEVAQGRRRSTGEVVAIKILKKKRYHGRVVKKELKLLQALRGVDTEESHIVRFLESFADGACTYLVFELLEQNLRDFQKKNNFLPLPVRHIRTITVQLLAALLKLKELSTIHADLKPENIMLVDHARYPFHILLGLPFCEKVDVWSLGCVMAELHLGWPLYPGINEYDQVRYICSTLGLPRGELLCAGWKTCSFFQRVPHPTGSWQLRAPGEEMVKPVERRRYVFSSLDQLATVHIHLAEFGTAGTRGSPVARCPVPTGSPAPGWCRPQGRWRCRHCWGSASGSPPAPIPPSA
uniref:Protein kinase domain-containing protein n=1 Tax=Strix occidentalis caurina TaxID=311401 RepID=A0A8D0F018_STROC